MSSKDAWTVGRMLQWTTEYLQRHGSSTPRLDAELLLAHSLACDRIELYTTYDTVPPEGATARFRELIQQRAKGVPVAYLLEQREFYSLQFRVTPDVLIPRPETELVVMALVDFARGCKGQRPVQVCDVGTGSGVIAVCAAKHIEQCQVTAVDVSRRALVIARFNAAAHGVADQIRFLQSDLLAAIGPEERFHFVVSNPPYVREDELPNLPRDVRDHEPHEALVAGPRGTEVIEALVPQAARHQDSGGHLLLEINPRLCKEICELICGGGEYEIVSVIKDSARLPRVVVAQRR